MTTLLKTLKWTAISSQPIVLATVVHGWYEARSLAITTLPGKHGAELLRRFDPVEGFPGQHFLAHSATGCARGKDADATR
jgi:hypothetical protein